MTKAKTRPGAALSTAGRVIAFIERYCLVPEGRLTGQPMRLEPFQKDFIRDVYDNPHRTRRAYLSIGRKNGKTALIAALVLAHVCGPVAAMNSQIISGARSRDQAAIVFKLAAKMIRLSQQLSVLTKIIPSSKMILGLSKNVEYKAISADAKTAHGLSPLVAILDEVGQVRGPQDDFVDAIETSQGAHEYPVLFAISTQAAQDTDLFSVWIDDALSSGDPTVVCHVHEAPKDCDLLDRDAMRAANPALGTFRSLADLVGLAEKAQRMPSFEPTYRNLNLNQRVDIRNPFVSSDTWKANNAPPTELEGAPVWFGLDLSAVSDLTALVGVTEDGSVHPTFWLPEEGLADKAREARAPYDVWHRQGHLKTTPGRTIQYEFIAEYLRGLFDRCNVQAVGFDRYNMRFLKPWLEKVGFDEEELALFTDFGQGFVSMSPALRELEVRLTEKQLRHGGHPVLTMCVANATVVKDPAGNRKFAKNKSTGRIDGAVALAMAVGVMPSGLNDNGDFGDYLSSPLRMRF